MEWILFPQSRGLRTDPRVPQCLAIREIRRHQQERLRRNGQSRGRKARVFFNEGCVSRQREGLIVSNAVDKAEYRPLYIATRVTDDTGKKSFSGVMRTKIFLSWT